MSEVESGVEGDSKNKGGRPPNFVWRFFDRDPPLGQKASSTIYGVCKSCSSRILYKSNSVLYNHVIDECTKCSKEDKNEAQLLLQDKLSAQQSASKKQKTTQQTMDSHVAKQQDKMVTSALLLFFIICNIPFRVVENPFFLAFVDALRPKYKAPG